jgi:hypothetical protein
MIEKLGTYAFEFKSGMHDLIDLNQLDSSLQEFEEISLESMDKVRLLNRFDSKYCLHASQLQTILKEICNDYYVLKIGRTAQQSYRSVYFDTPDNFFYISHHNGKANRIKIRKREYVNSGICFLEIKSKSNKSKTFKKRIPTLSLSSKLTPSEKQFISGTLNCNIENLAVKLKNSFNRITLVNKNFDERCTIDINIAFPITGKSFLLDDLVVIELKQGTLNMNSKLANTLKQQRIFDTGFSKYCIGRALTEKNLKRNMFKPNILKIAKQFDCVLHQNASIFEHTLIS